MQITSVDIWVVEIPQVYPIAPYRSHLRTSSTTQSAIVRVSTDQEISGWGEHNVNFLQDVNARAMQTEARLWLTGRDPLNISSFHRDCPFESRLKSGIELALWDIRGKATGQSVSAMLGGVIRDRIALAACMGISDYHLSGEIAHWCVERGFSTIKTKAGSDITEDVDMVRGIRDAVGNRIRIRVDPNRSYSLQQATDLCHRLEEFELEYIEQPIRVEPLTEATILRKSTSVPLALNESVIDANSVWEILRADAAEFILPDTHLAGGIQPCMDIGAVCAAAGIPCIMHCGHDLGPKTAAMLHIAAASRAYSMANDCTYYGLQEDILANPFQIADGCLAVPTEPGLGIQVDSAKVEYFSIT